MAPQQKYSWTHPAEKQCLRQLFQQVAANSEFTNVKQRESALFGLFKPLFPNNPLAPRTIWNYGKTLTYNPDKPLPGEVSKPPPFWNENTRADLLRCWLEATKAAKANADLGLFEGFVGRIGYRKAKS